MNKLRTIIFSAITLVAIALLGLPHLAVAGDDKEEDTIASTVTLWWVIFNKPEECLKDDGDPNPEGTLCNGPDLFREEVEGAVLYGTGEVTQSNGHVTLISSLYKTPDAIRGSFDPPVEVDPFDLNTGLKDPMGAEVHLVVRSHGPVIPSELEAQLTSFAGGCKVEIPQPNVPNEPGECADIQFAVHRSDDEDANTNVYTFVSVDQISGGASTLLRDEDSIRAIISTTVDAKQP